jgi:hypothetical protein
MKAASSRAIAFYANVTIAGGPAPVRAYIEHLLPDVLEGRIQPAAVVSSWMAGDGGVLIR